MFKKIVCFLRPSFIIMQRVCNGRVGGKWIHFPPYPVLLPEKESHQGAFTASSGGGNATQSPELEESSSSSTSAGPSTSFDDALGNLSKNPKIGFAIGGIPKRKECIARLSGALNHEPQDFLSSP